MCGCVPQQNLQKVLSCCASTPPFLSPPSLPFFLLLPFCFLPYFSLFIVGPSSLGKKVNIVCQYLTDVWICMLIYLHFRYRYVLVHVFVYIYIYINPHGPRPAAALSLQNPMRREVTASNDPGIKLKKSVSNKHQIKVSAHFVFFLVCKYTVLAYPTGFDCFILFTLSVCLHRIILQTLSMSSARTLTLTEPRCSTLVSCRQWKNDATKIYVCR